MNQKTRNDLILTEPDLMNGNPTLEGTRLRVIDVVLGVDGNGLDAFVETAKILSIDQIHAAIIFCATRECVRRGSHCGGCSLRPLQDKVFDEHDFINRFERVVFPDVDVTIKGKGQGDYYSPGNPTSFAQTWFGENGWIVAGRLLRVFGLRDWDE